MWHIFFLEALDIFLSQKTGSHALFIEVSLLLANMLRYFISRKILFCLFYLFLYYFEHEQFLSKYIVFFRNKIILLDNLVLEFKYFDFNTKVS